MSNRRQAFVFCLDVLIIFTIYSLFYCIPVKLLKMCDQEFRTLRIDPRYPFTNQTKACYDNYCDYHKCTRLLGPIDDCKIFKRYFETICPNAWIGHWDELRDKGAFPGPI